MHEVTFRMLRFTKQSVKCPTWRAGLDSWCRVSLSHQAKRTGLIPSKNLPRVAFSKFWYTLMSLGHFGNCYFRTITIKGVQCFQNAQIFLPQVGFKPTTSWMMTRALVHTTTVVVTVSKYTQWKMAEDGLYVHSFK